MLDRVFGTLKIINQFSPAVNIGMESVYSYDANSQLDILRAGTPKFTQGSIGCHWYGGHKMWEQFIRDTDGGLKNLPNNIIGNLLKNG
jgi:hypothetical protein